MTAAGNPVTGCITAPFEAFLTALFEPVRCAVSMGADVTDISTLHPEERRSTGRMSPERAGQFAAGRLQAERALGRLGLAGAPVPRGAAGAPKWPPGVTGSITHARGLCIAAVCNDPRVRGIGVDAEAVRRGFPPGAAEFVLTRDERIRYAGAATGQLFLLFSAKEATMKAVCQATGVRPEWLDISLCYDFKKSRFLSAIREGTVPRITEVRGRGAIVAGYAFSACAVFAEPDGVHAF